MSVLDDQIDDYLDTLGFLTRRKMITLMIAS